MYIEDEFFGVRLGITSGSIVVPANQNLNEFTANTVGMAIKAALGFYYTHEDDFLSGPHVPPAPPTLLEIRRKKFAKMRARLIGLLAERDGYICAHPSCYDNHNLTIDHIIPVSKGGSDDLDNLQFLCRKHNSSKGAK